MKKFSVYSVPSVVENAFVVRIERPKMKRYYAEVVLMLGLLNLSIMCLLVGHHPVYRAGVGISMKEAFVIQLILPAAVFGDALILGWKNKYNLAFGLGVLSSLNLGILLGYGFYRLGLMMYH